MTVLPRLALAAAAVFTALPAVAATEIVIGSSSPGGSYYLYAGGLASYLNEKSKEVKATARTTRGSVENARLIARDGLDTAFINAQVVHESRHGIGQFKDASTDKLRGVAVVDTAPSHWVVLAESGIKGFDDLKGKRVSIGAAGSGVANTAITVLTAMGLNDKLDLKYLGFDESATNLRDGNLDAVAAGSALPMPAIVDISTHRNIRILSIPMDVIKKVQQASPATNLVVIPKGTYRGVDYDVNSVANPSTLVARSGLADGVVYEIARFLLTDDNRKYMKTIYKAWDPEAGAELWQRIGVPLHPGAARAYKEAGLIK
ncbi:MAG: TAXI family TRAP transporter solute-binding subunit [Proteobacteria bacterium]|nr:TAXI family TRAP transporter solute-binding subunit [Pseudomonadota bacterium]